MSDSKNKAFSRLGFILVSAGSAVGVGNIWRFPYLVAEYGGGTFIFIYLFFALFLGLSIMLSEYVLGRYVGRSMIDGIANKLKYPKIISKTIYINLLISLVLMSFYFVVSGWAFYYFVNSLFGGIQYVSTATNSYYIEIFNNLLASPITLIFYTMLFVVLTIIINYKGVVEGVEKTNVVFLPLLFIILIVLVIRVLTLDGASTGIKYYFTFDVSKITVSTIISALGQAFFSLSLGMGTMMVFASNTQKNYNLKSSAISTVLIGSSVGIFSSLLVIPAVFSFGYSVNSGPGLTFLTLPQVFAHLNFGWILASLFFLILSMAAITSTLSVVETAVPYLESLFKTTRNKALIIILIFCLVATSLQALSFNVLNNVKIFGLDIFTFTADYLLNILLIIGSILICFMLGFCMSKYDAKKELTNEGAISFKGFNTWLFFVKYVTPLIITLAIVASLVKSS